MVLVVMVCGLVWFGGCCGWRVGGLAGQGAVAEIAELSGAHGCVAVGFKVRWYSNGFPRREGLRPFLVNVDGSRLLEGEPAFERTFTDLATNPASCRGGAELGEDDLHAARVGGCKEIVLIESGLVVPVTREGAGLCAAVFNGAGGCGCGLHLVWFCLV